MTTTTEQSAGLVTGADLARRLDVNGRTIRKWRTEGMPVALRGAGTAPSQYDEAAVRSWRDAREQRARRESAGLTSARARRELAQAIEGEQRVASRARRLLPAEEVDRAWRGVVRTIRAKLLSLPRTLAQGLCHASTLDGAAGIESELQRAIYQTLTELADPKTYAKKRRPRKPSRMGRTRQSQPQRRETP